MAKSAPREESHRLASYSPICSQTRSFPCRSRLAPRGSSGQPRRHSEPNDAARKAYVIWTRGKKFLARLRPKARTTDVLSRRKSCLRILNRMVRTTRITPGVRARASLTETFCPDAFLHSRQTPAPRPLVFSGDIAEVWVDLLVAEGAAWPPAGAPVSLGDLGPPATRRV